MSNQENTRIILSKLHELPALPEKCTRLEALMNDPKSSFADMTRLIETDVGLASKVLKLANSAHYSIAGGVQSLEKAVVYLGMTTIYQMVLCMQSQQILGSRGKGVPQFLAGHSLAVAMVAKYISSILGIMLPDRAFSAGLLHDFGRVAIHVLLPEATAKYSQAISQGAIHSLELEHEILGLDHQQVGLELAKHWKYPKGLAVVISQHHGVGPEVCDRAEEEYRLVSDIVAVADAWCWYTDWPGLDCGDLMDLDPVRLERIGLDSQPGAQHREGLSDLLSSLPESLAS